MTRRQLFGKVLAVGGAVRYGALPQMVEGGYVQHAPPMLTQDSEEVVVRFPMYDRDGELLAEAIIAHLPKAIQRRGLV